MNVETIKYTLPSKEICKILITELNHGVVSIQPTVLLDTPNMDPQIFQQIIEFLISQNIPYIKKVFFENLTYEYKIISFNLFGHITGPLRKELRRPLDFSELKSGKDDYKWVEKDFLPKFEDDIDIKLSYTQKKVKDLYTALKKGKIRNVSYLLSDTYDVEYNYVFDIHPTDLIPVFDIYIKTKITFPSESITPTEKSLVEEILTNKFKSFDVILIL